MKKKIGNLIRFILSIIMILCLCQSALADTLEFPPGLKTIEDEAFYGDQSLDKAVLPDGIQDIGNKAFGNSGLKEINLPDSLENNVPADAFDENVTFKKSNSRMIVLDANALEILFALHANEMIVGRGIYCTYPEEAVELPVVTKDDGSLLLQRILELKPDLIVSSSLNITNEQKETLESSGITVAITGSETISNLNGLYNFIRELGTISNKTYVANELVKRIQTVFSQIRNNAKRSNKTVFFDLGYGFSIGKDTLIGEVADAIGMRNAFDNYSGFCMYAPEEVFIKNPDYIITIQESENNSLWELTDAASNNHVFTIDADTLKYLYSPSYRLAEAAIELYSLIYNDNSTLFPDMKAPVFIEEHAEAYEAWWNNNVASLYKTYTQQAYSKDNVYSDHNFLLRKMAELADLKRDEDTANANQWKEKYNSDDNFWLLDDEARLRLTLTNLAKTIEEDTAKENLIVHKDLQNVSLVSLANQEVALTDNKMARIKDASDWAINAIRTAVNVYSVYENMNTETVTELSDKQKLANVFINAFKEAILRFPTAAMETLIEAQAKYDAAYILRAYIREYVDALKDSCKAYADYIADTYFGSNKLFEKDNNDYYGKAVKIFISAFNKAGSDEEALTKEARNAILSGTGYSYEEVLKYASEYTDDMLSRLDKQFWCQQFVNFLRDIAKDILKEIFDKWDEEQIIGMLDKFIVIEVKEDCSIDCSFDFDGLVEQMLDYQNINSTAVMLTGIQLSDNDFNAGWALVKNEIIGKKADGYVTKDVSKALKDNVKITGKIKKIIETAWKVGEGFVKMSHELIELNQIGQGKTLYDTYGCALIDSFGQRINMRAKGEIVTGMTEEHFATWDVKKKESQRQALVSLLNLDEYIVITYKNMKTINENNGNKFNSGYEWADDSDIDYALKTIRNIRTAIKDVPKECQIYEK